MIFLLDTDVPDAIGRVIEQAGHKAQRLRQLVPVNTPDSAILEFALARSSLLVTCNRDHFLTLARERPHAGIIVLIRRRTRVSECSHFLRLIYAAGEGGLRNNINFA